MQRNNFAQVSVDWRVDGIVKSDVLQLTTFKLLKFEDALGTPFSQKGGGWLLGASLLEAKKARLNIVDPSV